MALEFDGVGTAMPPDGLVVGRMTIADDLQTATGRTEGKETVQYSGGRAAIATSPGPSSSTFPSSFLLL